MGLDTVEIVMEWEDRFGITIPDEAAQSWLTPRDAIAGIGRLLQAKDEPTCHSARAFHILRRSFQAVLQTPRQSFRPRSLLADIVPLKGRADIWRRLAEESRGPSFPRLDLPDWGQFALLFLALSGLGAPWLFFSDEAGVLGLLASLGGLIIAPWLAFNAMRPVKKVFPSNCLTVADLVLFLVANHRDIVRGGDKEWSREEIAAVVKETTLAYHVPAASYREEAEFVKDLGFG